MRAREAWRGVLLRLGCLALAGSPAPAGANTFDGTALSLVWGLPFVGMLLSIALLPLVAPTWWHRHAGKVALLWAALSTGTLALSFGFATVLHEVAHAALLDYLPFVILLFALYTVAGGIGLFGDLEGSPRVNVVLLAIGAVLANLMGTTGAAMVLVRPLVRANAARRDNAHVLVFFIFIVANAGGALTPLGDPPLFLGFLTGVSFFWTTSALLMPTLTLVAALLAVFYLVDRHLAKREGRSRDTPVTRSPAGRLQVEGWLNVVLLFAIAAAVLGSGLWKPGVDIPILGIAVGLQNLVRDVALLGIAGLSLATTPATIRAGNAFNWAPMTEVAKLFAAIFVTIIPVIAILEAGDRGAAATLTKLVVGQDGAPVAALYFWATGLLSAFLDNAPTYLVFFNLAGGDASVLMAHRDTLRAISGGAVFMGALTYVGNAPNFMVRAIATDCGIRMPSFFGYMLWSVPVLIPLFFALTVLFFH